MRLEGRAWPHRLSQRARNSTGSAGCSWTVAAHPRASASPTVPFRYWIVADSMASLLGPTRATQMARRVGSGRQEVRCVAGGRGF